MNRRPRRPLARPTRGHRCEPVTQAERWHRDILPDQRWRLSLEALHGRHDWIRHTSYATDERARFWCSQVGIAFPGTTLPPSPPIAPPFSCAHDPDHGVPRPPLVDVRARAAGDQDAAP